MNYYAYAAWAERESGRERGVDKLHKVEKNNCGDRKTCKNTHTHTRAGRGRGDGGDVDTTKTDANNNCRKSYAA